MVSSMSFFALLIFLGKTLATPIGAPADACITMKPDHYATVPENSDTLPYTTILDKSSLNYDETLMITIKKSNESAPDFKGFLVVALAEMHGMPEHFVGMFTDFDEDAKSVDCIMPDGDAMPMTGATHTNNTEKSSITFKWSPNGVSGNVTFKTTYVQQFGTYWVKQDSGSVQVSPTPPPPSGRASSHWSSAGNTFLAVMIPLLALIISINL